MEALVEHRGKQFIVKEGVEVKVPFLGGNVGEKIVLDNILYLNNSKKKEFGKPYLKNISISAEILSHGRDDKVVVFKMKRRKGYQLKKGHRQNFTMVKVDKMKKATATKTTVKKKTDDKNKTATKSKKTESKSKTPKKDK